MAKSKKNNNKTEVNKLHELFVLFLLPSCRNYSKRCNKKGMKKVKNTDSPVFKCFVVNNKFYCYDTYTNKILSITREHYEELNSLQLYGMHKYVENHSNSDAANDILTLIDKGFFKINCISSISHPETPYLDDICMRGIYDMTLQVTRNCNFRCRYCSFARSHNIDRTHEERYMSWEVAKESIDFLFEHSKDSEEVYLSFYGGEPLLNFALIKQSVEYAERIFDTKKVIYNMTTNGSILSNEILEFLVKHHFYLLISLDGPREYQNNHRKFYTNGNDTFDIVMKNVQIIMQQQEYFKNYVRFSSVLLKDEPCNDTLDFFRSLGVESTRVEYTYANMNGIDYVESPYLKYKKHSNLKTENRYDIYGDDTVTRNFIERMQQKLSENTGFPKTWHHSGPCIPSVTKIFVNVFGEFFPCEKIIESPLAQIGTLKNGLDLNKMRQQMNIGMLSEERCKQCWAARFCEICVMKCIDLETNQLSDSLKQNVCEFQKKNIEDYLKYYVSTQEFSRI